MKEAPTLSTLTIPNDISYLPLALTYVRGIADLLGFDSRDVLQIELAVEEAAINVIEHAFSPDEKASFDIEFRKKATGLEIAICDKGLPYDPTLTPSFHLEKELDKQTTDGLGSFIMKSVMDEVQFCNLGFSGKETRLLKYYPFAAIDPHERSNNTKSDKMVTATQGKDLETIAFEARHMQSRDAIEVSRCFFDCYGYSYLHEHAYYPERLAALNESGELFSAIVVTPEGEVAAHASLAFSDFYPGVAELGMAATRLKYRGSKVINNLHGLWFAEADRRGLTGIFSEAVTVHTRSQQALARLEFKESEFLLAFFPSTLSFKGIAENNESRVSALVYFRFLADVYGTEKIIYPPAKHRQMICALYENFGIKTLIGNTSAETGNKQATMIEMAINNRLSLALVRFSKYGEDFDQRIHEMLYRVKREGIQVVQVRLNLEDPQTPIVAERLEKQGFIFTGTLPGTTGGDLMSMQHFNGIAVDYDAIHVFSDRGKELLDYIRRHDTMGGIN